MSRTLRGEQQPEQIEVTRASPSLLAVLGVPPALGRGFAEDEAIPGNEFVILADRYFEPPCCADDGGA
jgi:hypothetical protein